MDTTTYEQVQIPKETIGDDGAGSGATWNVEVTVLQRPRRRRDAAELRRAARRSRPIRASAATRRRRAQAGEDGDRRHVNVPLFINVGESMSIDTRRASTSSASGSAERAGPRARRPERANLRRRRRRCRAAARLVRRRGFLEVETPPRVFVARPGGAPRRVPRRGAEGAGALVPHHVARVPPQAVAGGGRASAHLLGWRALPAGELGPHHNPSSRWSSGTARPAAGARSPTTWRIWRRRWRHRWSAAGDVDQGQPIDLRRPGRA